MYRYKDRAPLDTVASVKRILEKARISVSETWFDSNIDNTYSLRITIANTDYGTNGKGATKELALASAYGELIERLGNGIIFKNGERKQTLDSGFIFMPDEIILTEEFFKNCTKGKIVKSILKPFRSRLDLALANWRKIDGESIGIPFHNEVSAEKEYVPHRMLAAFGSNGMAAGNSKSEAFVQAVSEIFERYCLQTVIRQKLTPPTICREYIKNRYPTIEEMLLSIERNSNLTVNLKYCGMDTGFPVIAVCLYDKAKHTDMISFGAHPVEEIAMERAITELFQGKNTDDICNLITERKRDMRYNILSVLKNGIGYFPREFHITNPQERYEGQTIAFSSNEDMKHYVLELCKRGKLDVYSRYIKIGDIYVVHVIIPGMSEIYQYDGFEFQCIEMKERIKLMLNGEFDNAPQTFQACLEFLDFSRKTPELDANLSKNFYIENDDAKQIGLLSLLVAGFYRLNMFDRALHYVELLKKYLPLDVCVCIQTIVELQKEDCGANTEYLKLYFNNSTISEAQRRLDFGAIAAEMKNSNKEDNRYTSESWLDSVRRFKEMIELV